MQATCTCHHLPTLSTATKQVGHSLVSAREAKAKPTGQAQGPIIARLWAPRGSLLGPLSVQKHPHAVAPEPDRPALGNGHQEPLRAPGPPWGGI